jgi:hypothetical protein
MKFVQDVSALFLDVYQSTFLAPAGYPLTLTYLYCISYSGSRILARLNLIHDACPLSFGRRQVFLIPRWNMKMILMIVHSEPEEILSCYYVVCSHSFLHVELLV